MIIFLDIDGVMVHANPHRMVELEYDGFYKFNKKAVEILQNTIYKTKDRIVLSSSHRNKYNLKEWKEILEKRGLFFDFLSVLDVDYSNNPKVTRKTEIIDWINKHKLKPEDVLIIDDDKSLNDLPLHFKERLVLTNPYVGLSNQNELKSVLKRKVKKTVLG